MGIVYKARHLRLDRLVALKMIRAGAGAPTGRPGPLRGRGPRRRRHRPPQHHQDLRDRRARRPALFLAGVPRGRQPGGADRRQTAAHRGRGADRRDAGPGHGRGPPPRDRPPRHQAGERPAWPATGRRRSPTSAWSSGWRPTRRQTGTGSILGSPSYMAPEQTTGAEKAGPAADQYALGATLYEMLTGRPPFRGSSILDTLDLVRTAEPVAPSQLLPRMPRDLETICLKALQKDPARRYPDVAAMAEDLRRFRAGEPIVARPISGPERAWRWCRRNPAVALLLGAVAASLLAGHGRHVVLRDPGRQPGARRTRLRPASWRRKKRERPPLVRRREHPGPEGLGRGRVRFSRATARRPQTARTRRAGPAKLRVVPLAAPVPARHAHLARPRCSRPLRGLQSGRQAARVRRRQLWPTRGGQGLGCGDGRGAALPARAQRPRILRGLQSGRPAAGLGEWGRAHSGRDQGLGRGRRTRAGLPARARHPRAGAWRSARTAGSSLPSAGELLRGGWSCPAK